MFIHNKFYILIRLSSFVEPESSTMCHVAVLSKFLSNNELNYVPILSQFYIEHFPNNAYRGFHVSSSLLGGFILREGTAEAPIEKPWNVFHRQRDNWCKEAENRVY